MVVSSLAEAVLAALPATHGALGGSLSVLRTFRLVRVFKLARSWKELNRIIAAVARSVRSVGWLSLLLLLLVFVLALCGMQILGFRMRGCDVAGAAPLCPPGVGGCELGAADCFVPCAPALAGSWFGVDGARGGASPR